MWSLSGYFLQCGILSSSGYFICAVFYLVDMYVNSLPWLASATPKMRKHLEDAIISPMEVVLKSKKQVVELKQRSQILFFFAKHIHTSNAKICSTKRRLNKQNQQPALGFKNIQMTLISCKTKQAALKIFQTRISNSTCNIIGEF